MLLRNTLARGLDVVCLSHLRWSFVFQRPQHLMTRCAADRRVFFIEEPQLVPDVQPRLHVEEHGGVRVVVPLLPDSLKPHDAREIQRCLLDDLLSVYAVREFVAWYYTPMALGFTDHWTPRAVVYDCMDELSAFKGAPPGLKMAEVNLLRRASLVLTGGHSLYKAKRHSHPNVHPVPSSVDVAHFAQARRIVTDPADQRAIPRPRLGFMGVIDERMDLGLIDGLAAARPDWNIVMIGPVVKVDPTTLPQRPNIHWLGGKTYQELPRYLAGWDVALLPFARNASTQFISPTKTPEYLAAGRQVVSTSITDVVDPYGTMGLVRIADAVPDFVDACAAALAEPSTHRQARADAFLATTSWDGTWGRINGLLEDVVDCASGHDTSRAADAGAPPLSSSASGGACSTISS